ncbi:Kinase [Hexamita inflata]|uniref:CAMK CAMKL n=1 Tax=Hexamita inflata TaxID=28002 RepID=A0AA86Q2V6_9EUKA|nr:CAMK CAMKL [Hexamita inflata]
MQVNSFDLKYQDGFLFANDFKLIRFIAKGTSSQCWLVEKEGTQFCLQIAKNTPSANNKLEIHMKLQGLKHITKIFYYAVNPKFNELNEIPSKFKIFNEQNIIIVDEYVPFKPLAYETFSISESIPQAQAYLKVYDLFDFLHSLLVAVDQLHSIGVYHFDLKPENILASDKDFYIVDFGSAQVVTDRAKTILDSAFDPSTPVTFVHGITPQFSSKKYDQVQGMLMADKYDAYSIGCILFYLITGKYLDKPLILNEKLVKYVAINYCFVAADLLVGLTHYDPIIRYGIKTALQHPILFTASNVCSFVLKQWQKLQVVRQFHFQLNNKIRKSMTKNGRKYLRSQSAVKTYEKEKHKVIVDDQFYVKYQNSIRHGVFNRIEFHSDFTNDMKFSQMFSNNNEANVDFKLLQSYYHRDMYLNYWDQNLLTFLGDQSPVELYEAFVAEQSDSMSDSAFSDVSFTRTRSRKPTKEIKTKRVEMHNKFNESEEFKYMIDALDLDDIFQNTQSFTTENDEISYSQ